MRRDKRHMNRANQLVGKFGELVKRKYGFVADPTWPLWKNVERRIGEMSEEEFNMRPANMACHNLLRDGVPSPNGTKTLLGLGLNYCIKSPLRSKITTKHTFTRLREDVRRMYALRDAPDQGDYIQSLYIKSDWKFEQASDDIEEALVKFKQTITNKQEENIKRRRYKLRHNLTPGKWDLIQELRKNDKFIIVDGDKNLGPCILERDYYIYRGCQEHLGNTRNYKSLTKLQAYTIQKGLNYRFFHWLSKYRPRRGEESPVAYITISQAEVTYLNRALKQMEDRLARFRMLAKVHKDPWKLRPIVCCAGTFMNAWSKWLDYQLQKLKHLIPTYVKDSQQVLNELKDLILPYGALLFTSDANSMYNNIDTDHAIEVITWWLNDLNERDLLPPLFPLEAVIDAMVIIMKNNIFEWGDLYFLQLLGTAMGTSAAVMWATIYYAYHEVHTLIPRHGIHLHYFKRFIDDIFGIWIGTSTQWKAFCEDVDDFGVLTWDIKQQKPSTSVNFLDLTLTIEGNKIVSKTYQKKMNLYLYLPSASAHPPGCIKGTIYSLVNRYYAQNTYRKDYIYFVCLLYRRLTARGWDKEYIKQSIIEASSTVEARATCQAPPSIAPSNEERDKTLYLHFQYHPDGISRQEIRRAYDEICGELFNEELRLTKPTTIAYSRPKNIRDYVSQAKLHQAEERSASTIMGEYIRDSSP